MPATPANAANINSSGVVSFNGTSFSESAITQHDVLVGGASNAISSVGPGTAGQIFLSGGAGANPRFVTPTAGGGMAVTSNASTLQYSFTGGSPTLIQSQTISNPVPSVNFTTGITSTYSTYFLLIMDLNISVASNTLLRFSSDGGSTYFSTGYNSAAIEITPAGAVTTGSSITNGLFLGYNATGDAGSIGIYIYNLANGSYPSISAIGMSAASPTNLIYNWGAYATQTAMNALQITKTSGTVLVRGSFSLYGFV
jgi:hypothetical protein